MNYTELSCKRIHTKFPETQNKSGYYRIKEKNDIQWTYCNMNDFISTCAGVGGGWKRIANININAEDDCPGEWRKATQSGVSFCRVASDDSYTCSSANFSTNGISYQRVCGRARGYQKGNTVAFYGSQPGYNKTIDQSYVCGLSITYSSNPHQHIWTYASGRGESMFGIVLVLSMEDTVLHPLLAITIIVNQVQFTDQIMTDIISMTHYGMEKDV